MHAVHTGNRAQKVIKIARAAAKQVNAKLAVDITNRRAARARPPHQCCFRKPSESIGGLDATSLNDDALAATVASTAYNAVLALLDVAVHACDEPLLLLIGLASSVAFAGIFSLQFCPVTGV